MNARAFMAIGNLWEVSEKLTGVHYEFPATAAAA
jgi:hypothetical protein